MRLGAEVEADKFSDEEVDCITGVVPGFAGKEGCRGVGGDAARARGGAGASTAEETAGGVGAGAGGAAAFARACASRSAVLRSCFLRISIRASSCLTFFTKSLTSPGLMCEGRYIDQSYVNNMIGERQREKERARLTGMDVLDRSGPGSLAPRFQSTVPIPVYVPIQEARLASSS